MARTCALCRHEDREQIEQEIVGGMSLRAAAKAWGLHYTQVQRHMSTHYPMSYVPRQSAYRKLSLTTVGREIDEVEYEIDSINRAEPTALDKIRDLHARVYRVMECSEQLGNTAEILRAASELRRIVELESRLTGNVDTGGVEESGEHPDYVIRIRTNFHDLPEDDPRVYEDIRYTWIGGRGYVIASGDEVVDAEYEECDDSVQ